MLAANDNAVLVSLNDCVRMTSLSRSMLNRLREQARFPSAIPLGERKIGFVKSEVAEWIADRINRARAAA